MEALFVLLVLGGGAYWFFRGNIRRGAEIMRANVFLTAIRHGKSKLEANGLAAREMSDLPPEYMHMANARASQQYGGVRMAMVADAYRHGMIPRVSAIEVALIQKANALSLSGSPTGGPWDNSPDFGRRSPEPNSSSTPTRGSWDTPSDSVHPAQASDFPADYNSYYQAYLFELKRLCGMSSDERHPVELIEEIAETDGDNITRENFTLGVDPKEYAAAVYAVMQRMPPDAALS